MSFFTFPSEPSDVQPEHDPEQRIGLSKAGRRAAAARDGRLRAADEETLPLNSVRAVEPLNDKRQRAHDAVLLDATLAYDLGKALRAAREALSMAVPSARSVAAITRIGAVLDRLDGDRL